MTIKAAWTIWTDLAISAALTVMAQTALAGEPLSSLAPRGAVQATDQLPILPANAPVLESTTAGAILGYVQNYPANIVCDGVHDDTAAIQAAITSGVSFALPPGTCVISAPLVVSTASSHGQSIRGAGETAADGAGSGKTVIRPTAAVHTAMLIDGSPFGGYVQGFSVEGLSLDMVNMPGGSRGFSQLQAYDTHYSKIRVMHDAGKTSWNFGPGAYTTSLNDVQGSLVYCLGNGVNNPTTITLVNPDIGGLNLEQCANVTSIGGSIQPSYSASNTIIWLPAGTSPEGFGPNPSGMYLALGSYVLNAQFISTVGTDWEAMSQPPANCAVPNWSYGTYNGDHGCHPIVMAVQVGGGVKNISLLNATFAGLYLYNLGSVGDNLTLTGYQTDSGQSAYHEGAETFNANVFLNNSKALYGFSGDKEVNGKETFLIDASSGAANFSGGLYALSMDSGGSISATSLNVTPTVTGANFANIGPFGCFNAVVVSQSSCFMGSGSKFVGLQDPAGSIQMFSLNALDGTASFQGNVSAESLFAKGALTGTSISITPGPIGNFATFDQFGCYHGPTAANSSCFVGSGSKFFRPPGPCWNSCKLHTRRLNWPNFGG